jgi:NitT/TauT family transport system substrate-binding protein
MAPVYIANDCGYFAEQGIDFEFVPLDSGALAVAPTAAGQIDVIMSPLGPGLFNALGRGVDLTGIASSVYADTVLFVRQELWDSGEVRFVPDLRGKRVSFNIEGSVVDFGLRNMLPKLGLSVADVEVQRLANTDLGPALVNGAVDAGVASDPTPLETRGIATRLASSFDILGKQTAALVVMGPSMRGKGDAPTRFLIAYLKGVRDLDAALQVNKVVAPSVQEILTRWTGIPGETIAQTPFAENIPDSRIDFDDLNQQQDFWLREGLVQSRVDLRQFVDTKYLDAALAQLR